MHTECLLNDEHIPFAESLGTSLHTECLPFTARASSIAVLDASEHLVRSGYSNQHR